VIHVFHDTWAYLALANDADPGHATAVEVDEHLDSVGAVAITSDWILDETLTALNATAGHRVALAFLDGIEAQVEAGDVTVLHVSVARRERAVTLFRRLCRDTPRLSLTDCTSFAVMHELSITHAFTVDPHFNKAGKGVRPLVERRGNGLAFRRP
jgi:predicted nucleic acid-binding protein